MSESSSFSVERAAREGGPAPTFELGGQTWTVESEVSAGTLFAFAEAGSSNDLRVITGMRDFLIECVIEEERPAFYALLTRRNRSEGPTVSIPDLTAVMEKVVRALTGTPFGRPSALPGMPSRNGSPSPAPADSEASTSTPHRRVAL